MSLSMIILDMLGDKFSQPHDVNCQSAILDPLVQSENSKCLEVPGNESMK